MARAAVRMGRMEMGRMVEMKRMRMRKWAMMQEMRLRYVYQVTGVSVIGIRFQSEYSTYLDLERE